VLLVSRGVSVIDLLIFPPLAQLTKAEDACTGQGETHIACQCSIDSILVNESIQDAVWGGQLWTGKAPMEA